MTRRLPGCGSAWHPVVEDHPEVGAEELLDHGSGVDVHEGERPEVGDLAPLDVLHRQDPARRELEERLGHDEVLVVAGEVNEPEEVLRLPAVVELADERAAELAEQLAQAVRAADARALVGDLGDLAEDAHVVADRVADVGALDLDDDVPAGAGRRAVDLTERGRCERLLVEGGEEVLDPRAELGLDDLLDLLEGEGLDGVLEPGQCLGVRRREEVEAGREQLAHLDVRRTHALEVGGEGLRGLLRAGVDGIVVADGELVELGAREQVGPSVAQEETDEVGVAAHRAILPGTRPGAGSAQTCPESWAIRVSSATR